MDLGFNLAQSNRDLKDLTSRQNFGDTSGLLCKNDLIPCLTPNNCNRAGCTSLGKAMEKKKGAAVQMCLGLMIC